MPTNAEFGYFFVDTSVAVPLVTADHAHHDAVVSAVGPRRLGLAGHAAFETFSVLTRLPAPLRRTAAAVAQLLATNFPDTRFISPATMANLFEDLSHRGLTGGSVYDALIAATAVEHHARLLSRDRRALPTYRELGVDLELLP